MLKMLEAYGLPTLSVPPKIRGPPGAKPRHLRIPTTFKIAIAARKQHGMVLKEAE